MENQDPLDHLEPLADKEIVENLGFLVLWEKLDPWDHLVRGVSKESPGALETMAYLAHRDHLDHPV